MANETSDRGETSFEAASGAHDHAQDVFFASAQHDRDDYFFGANPAAGPSENAQNEPAQQVPINPNDHVIRVPVTPGEILELAPPFTPDADMVAREANGNLAIKVGDVTVILEGFIDANAQAPVVVESSDGKPIDIATVIAQTDPSIDIQTAAGPAAGAQGQGADNTGAILAQLAGGAGLGGFSAVGTQDGTSLSYSLIDNSIRQELFGAAPGLGGTLPGFSIVGSMSEPVLRDPAYSFVMDQTYSEFIDGYKVSLAGGVGYADYNGTKVGTTTGPDDYIAKTTEFVTIPNPTNTPVTFNSFDFFKDLTVPTSDGQPLMVYTTENGATAFLVRPSDNAVIMVFHIDDSGAGGAIVVEAVLINRVDHPGDGADTLSIDFNTSVPNTAGGEGSDVPTLPGPGGHIDVQDDVPVAHDPTYNSFYGDDSQAPGSEGGTLTLTSLSKTGDHVTVTSHDFGSVDEDWLRGNKGEHNHGNHDQDNSTPGSNSDAAHGDTIGRTYVTGNLDVDFGADGPAGAGGNDTLSLSSHPDTDKTLALGLENIPDIGQAFVVDGTQLTSDGHGLVVLDHYVDSKGLEHLIVGYNTDGRGDEPLPAAIFATSEGGSGDVKVFELTLDVNPNDSNHADLDFQDFKFQLFKGIDQPNNPDGSEPTEGTTQLHFDVIGHDDDGDSVHTGINIHVNDDVPMVHGTHYLSFIGGTPDSGEKSAIDMLTSGLAGGGVTISKDVGYVDEDWLKGGNQDKDYDGNSNAGPTTQGDDIGKTKVFGLLDVSFGGDGPTTQTTDKDGNPVAALAIKATWDTSGALPTFKDADGNTYSSHGHELVVLGADAGHLDVGYKDGDTAVTVFTLDLNNTPSNSNFGTFVFTLDGPLDDIPPLTGISGPNGPETSLPIHFSVTATDADFDTASADIKISVNDDSPEVAVTYDSVPDTGSSGSFTLEASPSGGLDYGQIDEDWLSNGNHDTDNQTSGDQPGGTVATGHVLVNWGADGPAADNKYGFTAAEGQVAMAERSDGSTQNLLSGGHQVYLHQGPDGLVGYINADSSTAYSETSTAVFTLGIDSSGKFTFTLLEALDHPIKNYEDNLTLNFDVSAGTDFDLDPALGTIQIKVNDDSPEVSVTYDSAPDAGSSGGSLDYGQIDEDWLSNGNHDTDHQTSGDKPGGTVATGHVLVNWGADGPAADNKYGFTAVEGQAATAERSDGSTQNLLSGGHQVYLHQGPDGLVGYINADSSTAYSDASTPVFTLGIDSSGKFTFTLLEALDHPIKNYEDNLTLNFQVSAGTDFDLDSALGIVQIKVNDDAPQAHDDCPDPSTANAETGTQSGNLFTDTTLIGGPNKMGADGGGVSQISFGSTKLDVTEDGTTIAGVYGSLEIFANGDWTYTPKSGADHGDVFTFTLTDGDGDTAHAELQISNLGGDDDALPAMMLTRAIGPTHTEGSYDHVVAVTQSISVDRLTTETYHMTDATGGHGISGGAGNDLIEVTGSHGATLQGQGGDDIIRVTAGHNILYGGAGDDTLFGGSGVDDFYGGKGHDAMSGGAGDDVFHNVDAADLDGTNTLDGTHSIDGGTGFDTVDLHGLQSFDASQAMHIENVEKLDFTGDATGGGGTAATLSYESVYGITQVGGLHVLQVTGDAGKDTVHLDTSGGQTWTDAGASGGFETYTATGVHGTVTVHVQTGLDVS